MKKITVSVVSIILALMMLAACGKDAAKADVDVKTVYQKISESIDLPAEKLEYVSGDLLDYYGIDESKVADFAGMQDACGYKDEVVIIKAVDEKAAEEIQTLLNDHIAYQSDSMRNYDAEQFKILGTSTVNVNGVYVAMFISANQAEMIDIFNSFFE